MGSCTGPLSLSSMGMLFQGLHSHPVIGLWSGPLQGQLNDEKEGSGVLAISFRKAPGPVKVFPLSPQQSAALRSCSGRK